MEPIGRALSELIAARGWARSQADDDLAEVWGAVADHVAGAHIAKATRAGRIKRGILHVSVESSAMLGELAGFWREQLLSEINERRPELQLRDLKFRLRS